MDASLDTASSEEIVAALHEVAEPGRSALALLLIDALGLECLERMLGLPAPHLANVLDNARASLADRLKSLTAAGGPS
jgi:hypothetical protein